jgi:uncharacterized protein YbjT (DUF2867 family)
MGRLADAATEGNTVRLPTAFVQPIVSDDVVAALADVVMGTPINGTVEVAGPEKFRLDDLLRKVLYTKNDARSVKSDSHARYFGTELADDSLVPLVTPRLGTTRFDAWFSATQK